MNNQISDIIISTVEQLLNRACRKEEFMLLLGTAAVESDLVHRRQLGGGPARGLWQMEPATADDIIRNYVYYTWARFVWLRGFVRDNCLEYFISLSHALAYHLERFDNFACAMARIHYLRVRDPIPTELVEIAKYWKDFYNTPLGAGTVDEFLEKWELHGCDAIVANYFGEG